MKTSNLRLLVKGCLALVIMLALASCHDSDYLNAIPTESKALMSIDISGLDAKQAAAFTRLLPGQNVEKSGLDFSKKVYLFESSDGNLGFCGRVKSADDIVSFLESMKSSAVSRVEQYRGARFAMVKDAWLVGFNDRSFLLMGPVSADGQKVLRQQMAKYLNQDEDQGVTGSRIFARLDSIDSPMALVAQVQALPDKMIAPFTLGAPKSADASQVFIAAKMNVSDKMLTIEGETFSFNKSTNNALQAAYNEYYPITDKFVGNVSASCLFSIFMNVDGSKFIHHLHDNSLLTGLLAGINAAIDMDNIIKSFKGDVLIEIPSYANEQLQLAMTARLGNAQWLKDVAYWKKSCPPGSKIIDWQKNAYYYKGDDISYYFGVSPSNLFYSGSSAILAQSTLNRATLPLPSAVAERVKGKKIAMVINLNAIDNDKAGLIRDFLKPVFGDLSTIVYTLK
ncbi:DUF4836 family protein [Prevotella sp. A2931]|uniref:DUF4836 family protein n=1 Tax=Prevotella illustrans TaxID=2800387 RepID=A0ABS3M2R4_9BACT|nr:MULTISPECIES: DUF4836 family protein [Prevotella]MBO1362429.1 DUF4836 family protein [Prevotella illustrans]PTL25057.1 DUF4836 domain-containing protein [Prevotella sp. oral taxon 820]